jgi:uroporphyrinogen-III decarboxylase
MRRHSNPLTAYGVTYQDIAHAQFDATVIFEEIKTHGPGFGRRAELTAINAAISKQLHSAVLRHDPKHVRVDRP